MLAPEGILREPFYKIVKIVVASVASRRVASSWIYIYIYRYICVYGQIHNCMNTYTHIPSHTYIHEYKRAWKAKGYTPYGLVQASWWLWCFYTANSWDLLDKYVSDRVAATIRWHAYTYIRIYIYIRIHTYTYIYKHTHTYILMHTYTYIHMYGVLFC